MPKTPITSRILFVVPVKPLIQNPPLFRSIEWNAVETELGTMVEPRQAPYLPDASGRVVNMDVTDMGWNFVRQVGDDGEFYNQYGTGGTGMTDFNL